MRKLMAILLIIGIIAANIAGVQVAALDRHAEMTTPYYHDYGYGIVWYQWGGRVGLNDNGSVRLEYDDITGYHLTYDNDVWDGADYQIFGPESFRITLYQQQSIYIGQVDTGLTGYNVIFDGNIRFNTLIPITKQYYDHLGPNYETIYLDADPAVAMLTDFGTGGGSYDLVWTENIQDGESDIYWPVHWSVYESSSLIEGFILLDIEMTYLFNISQFEFTDTWPLWQEDTYIELKFYPAQYGSVLYDETNVVISYLSNEAYDIGFDAGIIEGIRRAEEEQLPAFEWLRVLVVDVAGGFLGIKLFKGVTVGALVGIPFALYVVLFVIGLIKGGKHND